MELFKVYKKVPYFKNPLRARRNVRTYEKNLFSNDLNNPRVYNSVARALEIEAFLSEHSERFLPSSLNTEGYERLKSVFAHPFIPLKGCNYPRRDDNITIITLGVDSSEAIVASMRYVNDLYTGESSSCPIDLAELYWSSAITLKEFRYKFVRSQDHSYISRDKKRKIEIPEVLIPEWSIKNILMINPPEKVLV